MMTARLVFSLATRCSAVLSLARFPIFAALFVIALPTAQSQSFNLSGLDPHALPEVAPGLKISAFAKEPLVRNVGALAFDARGRLFASFGRQFRNPKPDSPTESVVLLEDTDGDGAADRAKEFATGFNSIQSLAWKGRDLWIANAPDLTLVRDLDRDDEADEYVRIFSGLGTLEHGLHGLNRAPDGKLYMSKGDTEKSEGRVYRIWNGSAPLPPRAAWWPAKRDRPLERWSVLELMEEFDQPLSIWRVHAQDEMVRRGSGVHDELMRLLAAGRLSTAQQTWTAWALGRMTPGDVKMISF